MSGLSQVPTPRNEPVRTYAHGSPERTRLKAALEMMAQDVTEVPLVVWGKHVHTGDLVDVVMPHAHHHVVGRAHRGDKRPSGAGRACRGRSAPRCS
jgi:1-pyrroline-5-carboxylate dehydrogenase